MSETRKIKVVSHDEADLETEPASSAEPAAGGASGGPVAESLAPQTDAGDDVKELETRLEAKEKERAETYERMLRLTAEFENYKKRMAREMDDFRKYANQSLLKEMLSVVDHIELALQAANTKPAAGDKAVAEGLELTLKELMRVLEKFNVKPIAAAGKPFNPQFHEAILREACADAAENTVLREMQKGYLIGSRLLRPALVVVAAARPAGSEESANDTPLCD